MLDRFRHLVGPGVQWAVAYIGEAHASDTWPLKFSHERPTPTTLAQRAAYAVQCSSELGLDGFRLCVDGMANPLNAALGAWPTAYYVLSRAGQLLYIGGSSAEETSTSYDVQLLLTFLLSLQKSSACPR